ncbi:DsrE family protein [Tessaracoccus sp. MC1627]|jgi:predicted peroxiredoxin|uniref:DsrE family protein n=1 Tax=Tessaracoccus sp. MC1627 TaxID=2760312 RepID=UPI0016011CBD|nr:DsrE family protein [Tessaracoccus sp. MC1627]MBB1514273.1 DsrE family protein [Tessaracoccus sp. MC1627]
MNKAAISLTTGLEDAEKVTVAFLVAVGAAEAGRETLMFLTKEAVRVAVAGFARATACDGCPPLTDLMDRYAAAGGRYIACGVCVKAKAIDPGTLLPNAEVAGTVQLWEWIGEGATTFSF